MAVSLPRFNSSVPPAAALLPSFGENSVPSPFLIRRPRKFVRPRGNGRSTVDLHIADTEIGNQMEMHEHSVLFSINMDRTDFAEKCVVLTLQQINLFLREADLSARRVYQAETNRTTLSDLTAVRVRRLARTDRRLNILKFLCPETMIEVINFVGVQFGNRYTHARSGPGLAVTVEGRTDVRNYSMNGCGALDDLWFVMRRRAFGEPLSIVVESTRNNAGITPGMLQYLDLSGLPAWGVAIKFARVVDKSSMDLPTKYTRELASGLVGTANESHYAEQNAPTVCVLLSNFGSGMYRT